MTDIPSQAAGGRDIGAEFKRMPQADKILAVAALVVIVSFVIVGEWETLFEFRDAGWFPTLAFFGAVATAALVATRLFGVTLVGARLFTKLLILVA
ncbi:MAG: hypothetical protein ACREID_07370, partial [Planctomycetota bacterium]